MSKLYRKIVLNQYLSSSYEVHRRELRGLGNDLLRNLTFFRHDYRRLLPINKQAAILELGCGQGQFLEFLKTEGYAHVLGLDLSPEVINYCQNRGYTVKQTDFFDFLEQNDIQERYDAIIANDILEHFDKDEIFRLAQLIKQALKKNGSLIIKTPNASNLFLGSFSRYCDLTHEIIFTESSLKQIFLPLGFSSIEFYEPNLYCFYGHPLNYPAWLIGRLLKYWQLGIHKLHGSFEVKIVSNNLLVKVSK